MKYIKRFLTLSIVCLVTLPAQAGMVTTHELFPAAPAAQPADIAAQQQRVIQQLVDHGVDAEIARERVLSLDLHQLAELQGDIKDLPAGAGVSTTNLLLIIILLVLLL